MLEKLKALKKKLGDEREAFKAFYDSLPTKTVEGKKAIDPTTEQFEELRRREEALTALAQEVLALERTCKAIEDNETALEDARKPKTKGNAPDQPGRDDAQRMIQTPGEFAKAVAKAIYERAQRNGGVENAVPFDGTGSIRERGGRMGETLSFEIEGVNVKTLLQTSTGYPPESIRTGDVVPLQSERVTVLDAIPFRQSGSAAVVYMRQTTRTNNAAERAEGAAAGEAALAWEQVSTTHRMIGTTIPATEEQLDDVAGLQGLVEQELMLMVRQRLATQVINGDGIAPNIEGIKNVTGIQTTTQGADTAFDAYKKAAGLIVSDDYSEPSAYFMHPNDWQTLLLEKDSSGRYLLGDPGAQRAPFLWGLPVVQATQVVEGTPLVGDFAGHTYISYRTGVEVAVASENEDDFKKWKKTIRAGIRAALCVRRANAICELTLA